MSEIINRFELSTNSLEEQAKLIQKSYTNNTDIISKGVDLTVGVFGGETVKSIYEGSILKIREQAKREETQLLEEISKNSLNPELIPKAQKLSARLSHLQGKSLEDISTVQMIQNTDVKQVGINTLHGLKGEVKGVAHGLKGIITGAFDLASFMVKYSGSTLGIHPEYKQKIDEQAGQLHDWIKKEGISGAGDQIGKLIEQEIKRISLLPQEEQAEAIGNIAGNIISILTAIKAGSMIIDKTGKISRQIAVGSELIKKGGDSAQRADRLMKIASLSEKAKQGKIALQVANVFLNGVAESMIGYSLAKSLAITLDFIKLTTPSIGQKITKINESIKEMEGALKTEKDPQKQKNIADTLVRIREEKIKFERPEQNLDEITINAGLTIDERLKKASELLGGKVLSHQQQKIIGEIHNNISKGVYQNGYTEIRKMSETLKGAGFQRDEIRILMENGVLGMGLRFHSPTNSIKTNPIASPAGMRASNKTELFVDTPYGSTTKMFVPGVSEYDIQRLVRIEGPEEKMIYREGMSRPIEDLIKEQDRRIQEALRNLQDLRSNYKETPEDIRDNLTRKRKRGARDTEHMLDRAKQQGAALLREGENLMRANPGISGERLGAHIRKHAEEIGIRITPLQERILNAQMKKYDSIIQENPFYRGGIVDDYPLEFILKEINGKQDFVKSVFKKHVIDYYPGREKLDFIYQSVMYLFRSGKIGMIENPNILEALLSIRKFIQNKNSLTAIDVDNLKRFYSDQNSIDHIADSIIPYLGIVVDPISYPGVTLLKYPIEILNGKSEKLRIMQGGTDNGSFDSEKVLGNYSRGRKFIYIGDTSGADVIEHEYQHFLNDIFLSPDLLLEAAGDFTQNIKKQERKMGRVLDESSAKRSLWRSMQDELCSYLERNGKLPIDIDSYMNSNLKKLHTQNTIPSGDIIEIQEALQEIKKYFDKPLIPRDILVGIIRTSHSMEDMLARLRKNFNTLIETQNIPDPRLDSADLYGPEPRNRVKNIQIPD